MNSETGKPYQLHLAARRADAARLVRLLACHLQCLWRGYRQWRAESDAIRHLHEIDDYLLEDVGIGRCDIRDAVRGKLENQQGAEQTIPRWNSGVELRGQYT